MRTELKRFDLPRKTRYNYDAKGRTVGRGGSVAFRDRDCWIRFFPGRAGGGNLTGVAIRHTLIEEQHPAWSRWPTSWHHCLRQNENGIKRSTIGLSRFKAKGNFRVIALARISRWYRPFQKKSIQCSTHFFLDCLVIKWTTFPIAYFKFLIFYVRRTVYRC